MRALFVALGAGIGAPSRYILDKSIKRIHRSLIPIETLSINTVGSFVLGLMINSHGNIALIIGTGFAGAFTTEPHRASGTSPSCRSYPDSGWASDLYDQSPLSTQKITPSSLHKSRVNPR